MALIRPTIPPAPSRSSAKPRLTSATSRTAGCPERAWRWAVRAEAAVRALVGEPPDRLSLGAFASAGKVLLPRTLAVFGHEHPHVRLSLSDIEPPGGYDLVTSGELDLLVTHRYPGVPLPRDTGLHRERILVDPLLVVAPLVPPLRLPAPNVSE